MPAEVYRGPVGDLVKTLEPHTESDPHALLMQSLAAWGSQIGRGPYYQVESTRHYPNLYVNLVGMTSKSRKGTSWGRTQGVLSSVDEQWVDNCIVRGLASGEALVDIFQGDNTDKRCLILEAELARLLALLSREGNTISAMLREAWDWGELEIKSRRNKVKVHDAHVSMIGHITKTELLKRLDNTELANGLCNRMLWLMVKRSKMLPHGGGSPEMGSVMRGFHRATEYARGLGVTRVKMDMEASEYWEAAYAELSEGHPGLLGDVTSRGEAQVLRLALIYALLDSSPVISAEHLTAALGVWRYCYDSCRYIWGTLLGDPTADAILGMLRSTPGGMTRSEISVAFAHNKSAAEIDRPIGVLMTHGRIRAAQKDSGGRPVTRYYSL